MNMTAVKPGAQALLHKAMGIPQTRKIRLGDLMRHKPKKLGAKPASNTRDAGDGMDGY